MVRYWLSGSRPAQEVVGAALKLIEGALASRTILADVADDVPLVEFDALMIELVIRNPAENAAKYSPAGAPISIRGCLRRDAMAELTARVRALLRRQVRPQDSGAQISFGEVVVDLGRRSVTRNGEAVHLTPLEYRLLALLVGNPGKVLTHPYLLRTVWGPSYTESSHYLRTYVGRLRQTLEADPAQPRHLLTETGVGYRFQP